MALATLVGVFGLLIGSFLNVVVYRVPAGLSVVRPASACPRCNHEIRRRDNVPVLSWLLLRGRCRDCAARIPVRYPAVEAVTCALFVAVAAVFVVGPGAADLRLSAGSSTAVQTVHGAVLLVAFLYLMAISVSLALIDLDTHTLPNKIVLPAYVVLPTLLFAATVLSADWQALLRAVIGAAVLGFVYLALAIAVPGGMGLGDVKLAGVLGFVLAYLGWGPLAVGSFSAFLLGGIFAIVLLILRRTKRGSGIPFGPWMLLGAWVGIVLGGTIWDAYLHLLGF
jgi:leader peptidase (prepilin peptidase) / N-methyltransferase